MNVMVHEKFHLVIKQCSLVGKPCVDVYGNGLTAAETSFVKNGPDVADDFFCYRLTSKIKKNGCRTRFRRIKICAIVEVTASV
jgi:hypothetical protein